jgi:hypothetical protein
MSMQVDDPGHDGVAAQIKDGGTVGSWYVSARGNRDDLAALDYDVPICTRPCSCSIDHSNVLEHHFLRADADVLLHLGTKRIGCLPVSER